MITLFPGHAAEEVERFVTIPIENEMNSIPKRASLRSISIFGLSVVTIIFEDDADGFVAQPASQQLQSIDLPAGAQPSLSSGLDAGRRDLSLHARGAAGISARRAEGAQDWVVERQFRTVPGVVDVVGFGGPTKQYQVLIDPAKLRSYGITLNQVVRCALAAATERRRLPTSSTDRKCTSCAASDSSGTSTTSRRSRSTRAAARRSGSATSASVQRSAISCGSGASACTVPRRKVLEDEDDVVQGIVLLRRGENALEVLERVRAKVEEINRNDLPPGVRLVPHYDRTELIERTLHTVRTNMVEGIGAGRCSC